MNIEDIIASPSDSIISVAERMSVATKKGMPAGICLICSNDLELRGVLTDGDLRRALIDGVDSQLSVDQIMTRDPIVFQEGQSYNEIIEEIPRKIIDKNRYRSGIVDKVIIVNVDNKPVEVLSFFDLWEKKTLASAKISVIGLGYVGLTLALALAQRGFLVEGVEKNIESRKSLSSGRMTFYEKGITESLTECLNSNFHISENISKDAKFHIVCVGTPVDSEGNPKLDDITTATNEVGASLKSKDVVIYRSTLPIGTCRDIIIPELERASGLLCGKDFHFAFAPERTVEGKALEELNSLPQIVSGFSEKCANQASNFFSKLTPTIIQVACLEEAELIKLMNNSFRDYKFAFSNQMVTIANAYGIDPIQAIRSANQGYARDPIPMPSPGVGGPCLKKDPLILAMSAKKVKVKNPLMEQARSVNIDMVDNIVDLIKANLEHLNLQLSNAKIFLCGMAFKGEPETSDLRDSPSVELYRKLIERALLLKIHDPVATEESLKKIGTTCSLESGFNSSDLVIFLTNSKKYRESSVLKLLEKCHHDILVFDCWSIFNPTDFSKNRNVTYSRMGFIYK